MFLILANTAFGDDPGKSLGVVGWPLHLLEQTNPTDSWAGDPILGRMVCPALTRLNLLTQQSEPLLAQKVSTNTLQTEWNISLKPNLKWWSKELATSAEISKILKENLPNLISKINPSSSENLSWSIHTYKDNIRITWKKPPKFGVYILNNLPIYRKNKGKLDCLGRFSLVLSNQKDTLPQLTDELGSITFSSSPFPAAHFDFKFPHRIEFNPKQDAPDRPISCRRPIDFPIVSGINWNPHSPLGKLKEFRVAMTHLTPRGSLLRNGAGHLGDLVSAPILRAHPGYNRKVLVRSYNPMKADNILKSIGYIQKNTESKRINPAGVPMKVRLQSPAGDNLFVIDVIKKSFAQLGIQLEIVEPTTQEYDGTLTGTALNWPSLDLTELLEPFSVLEKDPQLSKQLAMYRLSLTKKDPDFSILRNIHKNVYNIEPTTVLMQHRACLISTKKTRLPKILIRDPDWFMSLIAKNRRTTW